MNPAAHSPSWTGRLGVFDLETTGIDVQTDRIVTAHIGVIDRHGRQLAARDWLADPGIPIPDGAAAVHGVTTEHARAHGRPSDEVVAEVSHALTTLLEQGLPIVAYNAAFDFSLLAHEARRHGVPALTTPHPVIDPFVIDKAHDRYRRGKRTLSFVAEHYAVPLDAAHEAAADALAAGRVALALARRFGLPDSAAELHTQQIGWAREQARSLTEYFIRIGRLDQDEQLDGDWPLRARRDSGSGADADPSGNAEGPAEAGPC